MSRKTVFFILFAVALAWLVVSSVRRAFRALTTEGPVGFGLIFEACPKCGHQVVLSPGKDARCESCGEHLAACERCGTMLKGPDVAKHDPGTAWLCEQHRNETDWESACLHELGTQEALTPPPDTPKAAKFRRHYERQVRAVFSQKKYPDEALFPFEKRQRVDLTPGASHGFPKSVVEAYRFYERAVMDRQNGTVGIFPWDFEGSPVYLVQCDTDGSDGFLEIYNTDGSPLGYARTDWGCPAWTSRGVVRRRAFTADRDDVDRQVADAVKRLRGNGP